MSHQGLSQRTLMYTPCKFSCSEYLARCLSRGDPQGPLRETLRKHKTTKQSRTMQVRSV